MNAAEEGREMLEAWNRHDIERAVEMVTDDHIASEAILSGETYQGREGVRYEFGKWRAAFADGRIEIKSLIGEGATGAVEGIFIGTHSEALPTPRGTIEPTGKQVKFPFCSVYTLREGRVSSSRHYWDEALVNEQLGLS